MNTSVYGLFAGNLCLYVGKTKNIKGRRNAHRRRKEHGCGASDIPRYIDWEMRILEVCTEEKAGCREIDFYDVLKPLYNRIRPRGKSTEEMLRWKGWLAMKAEQDRIQREYINTFLCDIGIDIIYGYEDDPSCDYISDDE
jgi:predicted GIY-YIG superfamily endonuclease